MEVMPFAVKSLLNTQHSVGRCTRKSPIMKWANVPKQSSKIHRSRMQLLATALAGTLTQVGS